MVFAQGVKLGGDVVEFSEDGLGVGENNFAVVVQNDVAALAVEQFGAEFVFDARKCVGQRRLGHAQRLGGFGDVLTFSDGDEILELEQVHEGVSFQKRVARMAELHDEIFNHFRVVINSLKFMY